MTHEAGRTFWIARVNEPCGRLMVSANMMAFEDGYPQLTHKPEDQFMTHEKNTDVAYDLGGLIEEYAPEIPQGKQRRVRIVVME